MPLRSKTDERLSERLAARGFRSTAHREHVYHVLVQSRDHPTAEQIFMRAKKSIPEISMATVYNCLETLVKAGLVREVVLGRSAVRYCLNMHDHCHFYCDICGEVHDISFREGPRMLGFTLPKGFHFAGFEVLIRGTCPDCAANNEESESGSITYEHSH